MVKEEDVSLEIKPESEQANCKHKSTVPEYYECSDTYVPFSERPETNSDTSNNL